MQTTGRARTSVRRNVCSCGYTATFMNASTTLNVACAWYRIAEATATSAAVKPYKMGSLSGLCWMYEKGQVGPRTKRTVDNVEQARIRVRLRMSRNLPTPDAQLATSRLGYENKRDNATSAFS